MPAANAVHDHSLIFVLQADRSITRESGLVTRTMK